MSDDRERLADDLATVNRQVLRVLAVGGWWAAGLGTLLALGPGLEFLPPVVLPIAAGVAALSSIPAWRVYRDRQEAREAGERLAVHQEKERLKKLKGDLASVPTEPEDPRALASRKLLARIEELGDDATTQVARKADRELTSALADVRMLESAVVADRDASPDRTPDVRLQDALAVRNIEVEDLVRAIRDLHASLTLRDDTTGAVLDDLRAVLDRANADAEVRSAGLRARSRSREQP